MAAYDYRCLECDAAFEVRRPIDAPRDDVACPSGHRAVSRVFTPVMVGAAASLAPAPAAAGGCCGGGCCG